MLGSLEGKAAIVTGGGQGIGAAIARRFAEAGASVLIATRTGKHGQTVADEIVAHGGKASVLEADVGHRDEVLHTVRQAAQTFGRLDIVVHNAGGSHPLAIEKLTEEEVERTLAVNLTAGIWLMQAALPHLRKQGGGRFLCTSSIVASKVAMPTTAAYAAAKGGMNGLIRTAALELARENITVNGVEPGSILTPAMSAFISEDELAKINKHIPLGKMGVPDDVAYAMLYLASDEAAYVTGQTLIVDGGATLPVNAHWMEGYYSSIGK